VKLIGLVCIAATGCAAARTKLRACGSDDDLSRRYLVGVGISGLGGGADSIENARQRALANLAEQFSVQITSQLHARDEAVQREGITEESSHILSQLDTRSDVTLDGTETLEACASGENVRVRVGLERVRFVRDGLERLRAQDAIVRDLDKRASVAATNRKRLEAVALWSDAADGVRKAERLALMVQIVGREQTQIALPGPREFERRADEALAAASVRIDVRPIEGNGLVAREALACLGRVGVPVVESSVSPDAVVTLDVTVDPPLEAAPQLFIARAHLAVALRRGETLTAVGGASGTVKGGGSTPDAARREAVRRLSIETLPGVLDDVVANLGVRARARCAPTAG